MLVKEVTRVGSERLTTGAIPRGHRRQALVRDDQGREGAFPGQRPVGRRVGLVLFLAKEPARNVATDYSTDCRTCHVPAKKDDWVYVRGYPVLAKAAPAK